MSPVGFFDTHAHYDDERFAAEFAMDANGRHYAGTDDAISYVHDCGADYICNVGASLPSSHASLALADRYPFVYAAVGLHPSDAQRIPVGMEEDALSELREMARHKKAVAIGEIGLDYHYDDTDRARQHWFFDRQLTLAEEAGLPVVIHDREAHGDMMDILRKYKPKGVVHCFSGSAELAQETVKLGMYIGLGGVVTFKNARHSVEVAKAIPLDRLLTETDAPYMAPVPFRGKRCDSSMIPYDAAKIAEVRGITAQEVLETACENACRLFGITLPSAAK